MAYETVHGNCCAPGSVSALPALRDLNGLASIGTVASGLQQFDALQPAEFYSTNSVAACIPVRPKPPAVLRI